MKPFSYMPKIFLLLPFTLMVLVAVSVKADETVSQFEQEMLLKPTIEQPADPFVEIFLDAGCDGCSYGFQTDGDMTVDAWKRLFTHIGYLTAYSVFKPAESEQWKAGGRDIAPAAAQALGRHSGGSIMGLPDSSNKIDNVRAAYRTELGLGMTHFFHDYEKGFGTPGGDGATRLKLSANGGYLRTDNGSRFAPLLASAEDAFKVRFGLLIGDYIFGGNNYLLGHYTVGADDKLSGGWVLKIYNSSGYAGDSRIIFETANGDKVSSVPFNAYIGRTWLDVSLDIHRGSTAGTWEVAINIDGVGTSSGTVRESLPSDAGSGFIVGSLVGQTRDIEIDDLVVSASISGNSSSIAEYYFEPTAGSDAKQATPVTNVSDDSGLGHVLIANQAADGGIYLAPTTGIEHERGSKMKQYLVDDILSAREASGESPPQLVTNWQLSDRPGRADAWKSYGFTHGSAPYYYYGKPQDQKTRIATVLLQRVPMELRAKTDAMLWGHAWLGNVHNDRGVLRPEEFGSLVVMGVLEGYRWFSDFVAMSGGHLALKTADKSAQVKTNAEAIYAMAEAASWFQDTSGGLSDSVYYIHANLTQDNDVLMRSRINNETNEMWFAGHLVSSVFPGGRKTVNVSMPASNGVVVNLATGESSIIDSGVYQITVNNSGVIHPYYFRYTPIPVPEIRFSE